MRIRSITCFVHPRWPVSELVFQKAGLFARMARQSFENAGYAVQTVRMATPPFAEFITEQDYAQAGTHIDVIAHSEGFEYVSLGPALTGVPQSYAAIPELLSRSGNLFFGGHLTTPNAEVSLSAVRACAQVIHQAATLEANGFANLRFAALANVPPWAPFFPAAYHQGKSPAFALALEAADLAVSAFTEAQSLQDARQKLVDRIEAHARDLQTIAVFKRSGFNGLMLPLLEDATLAARGAQGVLGVNDLLLYSAVCGTGLDTIPLPGETSVEQLSALLLDLAALALRLDKPLTARLMPIPGKAAGDDTNFNFEYFANSKVLALPAEPLTGLLSGDENIAIQHRVD